MIFSQFVVYMFVCLFVAEIHAGNDFGQLDGEKQNSASKKPENQVDNKANPDDTEEKVQINYYYESQCPYCINFSTTNFVQVVTELAVYLEIYTYPYGNAETHEENGDITFTCQHGEPECYGNKLHACALDAIQNQTHALLYNSCMMKKTGENKGSDDAAADRCGENMNVDSQVIKGCAKGPRGVELLKYHGEESKKANVNYVPYVLINGEIWDGEIFMDDVCAAFKQPPSPCQKK